MSLEIFVIDSQVATNPVENVSKVAQNVIRFSKNIKFSNIRPLLLRQPNQTLAQVGITL